MPLVRYLTHPQVLIDPAVEVPQWPLNDQGQARVAQLTQSLGALRGTTHVISSDEVKALETARPLAKALGADFTVRPKMHENDRSATGFLPPSEFEAVADQFFAQPDVSILGWETARAAQQRILSQVQDCLTADLTGDVLFVGHGGVGTLLYCALAGVAIDRTYDQGPGGGGNWFGFDSEAQTPFSQWQPMETLSG
ncbi:MAG: phosphoglycerate mutase family protein [Pelagimonas sp.]|jgi:broad specificity phosphatase PhoE|nr:phosphoglycerate mutase family protein [Pelagimonas sp.]